MVTPPIFCAGCSANRGATASAHLPPKYPSCRGVTQDFAKSFSAQHGQPKYLSKRTVNIGKPTKELNGISLTMLGMRHSFCQFRQRIAKPIKVRFWHKADIANSPRHARHPPEYGRANCSKDEGGGGALTSGAAEIPCPGEWPAWQP